MRFTRRLGVLVTTIAIAFGGLTTALLVQASPAAAATPAITTCSPVKWSSSDAEGTHNYANGNVVQNDAWNGGHGPQTISACKKGAFYAVTNQPNNGGAVETYPSFGTQWDWPAYHKAISTFTNVTLSYSFQLPAYSKAHADEAVDDWIGGQELMIWHDWTQPKGDYPPSGAVPVTMGGVGYEVYHSGTYTAFYRDTQVTSETFNEVPFFQYMEAQGWITPSSVVDQFTNGVEVSDTVGTQTFSELSTSLTIAS
jgi:hypothetical protein